MATNRLTKIGGRTMSTTYELYKTSDDDTLVTMLLLADDQEESLNEAAAEDAERAERLRSLLAGVRHEADELHAGPTAPGAEDEQDEQDEQDAEENDLIVTDDGRVLDGSYRFVVNVDGYFMLYEGDQYVQYMHDPVNLPLGTTGSIQIDAGVPSTPEVDPPPAPADEPEPGPQPSTINPAEAQQRNIGILNAMFVDGASASQRSARVVSDGFAMALKNVNEDYSTEKQAGMGVATITFTRNRMSPNEITITDEGGIDRDFVRQEIQQLFDLDLLTYPYRDKSRVKIR